MSKEPKLLAVLLLLGKPHATQKQLWSIIIAIRYRYSFLSESHKEKFVVRMHNAICPSSPGANSRLRIILLTQWNVGWQLAHKIANSVAAWQG